MAITFWMTLILVIKTSYFFSLFKEGVRKSNEQGGGSSKEVFDLLKERAKNNEDKGL